MSRLVCFRWGLFFVFILVSLIGKAQTPGQCLVTIKAKDVCAFVNEDPFAENEFIWNVSAAGNNICIEINGEPNCFYNVNRTIASIKPIQYNAEIALALDAWEDDAGSPCIYNDSDDARCTTNFDAVTLEGYRPGELFEISGNCGGQYSVTYQFIYSPPVPGRPTINVDGWVPDPTKPPNFIGNVCGDSKITLSANSFVSYPNMTFTWEYRIGNEEETYYVINPEWCGGAECDGGGGGPQLRQATNDQFLPPGGGGIPACCDLPQYIEQTRPRWRTLGSRSLTNNKGDFSVFRKEIMGLENISQNTIVTFQVKASAGSLQSVPSPTTTLDISPLPPIFSPANVTIKKSCETSGTGEINVTGITGGSGRYHYFINEIKIVNGVRTILAGPDKSFTGSSFPAPAAGLVPGNYQVTISNDGGSVGACFSSSDVTIGIYDPFIFSSTIKQDISCHGANDGKIKVSVSGGDGGIVNFKISPSAGLFVPSATDKSSGQFINLPPNSNYVITASGCMKPVASSSISITQPTQVTGSFTKSDPTCLSTPNGMLTVTLGTGITGTFNYYLSGTVTRSNLGTTATSWILNDLPSGTYQIDVRDAARPSCAGYYPASFSLSAVTPLSLAHTKLDITCFAAGDGKITLAAGGGSGSYQYTLLNTTTGQSTNGGTNPVFTLLPKGNYTAMVKNSNSCTDEFSITDILVNEPDDITFSFDTKRITCNGSDNGSINATILGGNGGNVLQWQYNDGSGWKNYALSGGQSLTISNLFPADYRLKVLNDAKSCSKISASISILEPTALTIPTVTFTHITCLNANDGTIQVAAAGGWGNYTYQYSANGGGAYSTLLPTAKLPPGTYGLRVIENVDGRTCVVDYPSQVVITQPSQAMGATYVLSNYNGFNVSCSNGSDGRITVAATGGNGTPFVPGAYTFSVDGSVFASSNVLSGLTAESHEVRVKDLRGCIFTDNVTLSAPTPLTISLVNKNVIKCFGDNTGQVEVTAGGGLLPYQFNIDGGAFQTSPKFENLLGGAHTIMVRDKNNCTTTLIESIDSPNPPIIISFTKTDVSCFGANDGKIIASIGGGSPTYTYTWIGRSETGNTIQDLSPGSYTLKITDQETCSQQKTISIVQPSAPLSAKAIPKPVQCFGDTNGEIQVIPAGGTAPYSYSINNGTDYQVSDAFTNLSPDDYSILVKDFNACIFTVGAKVTEPPLLTIAIAGKQDVLCFGESTGSIQVNALGGMPIYKYSLDGITYTSSSNFTLLPAGNYLVRVRDSYGCVRSVSTTLTQPIATLSISFTMIPVQCKGDANGKIETTISGGTLPYSYAWAGLSQKTNSIDNLAAFTYNLTVTDANGCQLKKAIVVTEPTVALTAAVVNKKNISCFGLTDGSFKVDVVGGYPPYQFAFQGTSYSTINEYSGLSVQLYSVTVKDALGCMTFASTSIVEPQKLSAVIFNTKNVSCFSGTDGKFEVSAIGGTAPFTFSKDGGGSYQAQKLFDQLAQSTYSVMVKDFNGCTFSLDATITEPTFLQSEVTDIVNSACGQPNGSAKATGNGGTPPYSYKWKNSLGQTVSTFQAPTNLFSGFYTVTLTDSKNCSIDKNVPINDENAPAVAISSHTDATCFDSADGQATSNATGGAGGYTYLWSDVAHQTSPTARNLVRGSYFVTITDSRECKSVATVDIGSPSAIQYTMIKKVLPLCNESCNGEIEIAAFGGVGPYTYTWPSGEIATHGKASQLCKGIHLVKITDAIGCSATFSLLLDAPAKLDLITDQVKLATCSTICDASISITVTGGTAPYALLWNDPLKQTTSTVTNLCAGSYKVTITDTQGCTITKTITIDKTEPLNINLGGTLTLCYKQTKTIDAGVINATYNWTKDNAFFSDKKTVTLKDAGEYELKVVDTKGCNGSGKLKVSTSSKAFEANFLGATELIIGDTLLLTEVCFPKADSLKWTFGDGIKILGDLEGQPQITALKAGDYTIKMNAYYSECSDGVTKSVTFYNPEDKPKIGGRISLGEYGIKSITAHPNPTSGLVSLGIELFREEFVVVFLYSIDGIEIARGREQSKSSYQFNFDLSNYAAGAYIARVVTNNEQKDIRIVLIK
jgi:SprB repeat